MSLYVATLVEQIIDAPLEFRIIGSHPLAGMCGCIFRDITRIQLSIDLCAKFGVIDELVGLGELIIEDDRMLWRDA